MPEITLAVFSDTSNASYVLTRGKLFEAGNYPDKSFALSESEMEAAAKAFQPVPMNNQHKPAGSGFLETALNGCMGRVERVWREGKDLLTEVKVPRWLHDACKAQNVPLKVSAEWDREKKRLLGAAWVLKPRITDAQLIAAFSAADNRKVTTMTFKAIEEVKKQFKAAGIEKTDAEVLAMFADDMETATVDKAKQLALDLVRENRILPAQTNKVAALFAQANRDDMRDAEVVNFSIDPEEKETGTRAELLYSLFSELTPHNLTTEQVASKDADSTKTVKKSFFTLGNTTQTTEKPNPANADFEDEDDENDKIYKARQAAMNGTK